MQSLNLKQFTYVACTHAILLFALYAQSYWFDYVYFDDNDYVLRNSFVLAGLSLDGIYWAFSSFYMSNWHPLTWMSHMLDVSLFGPSPGWAHIHNIFLHGINSMLVYVLILRLTRSKWKSLVLSVIFLVHPQHVESVAWIAERKDLLCALFFLLGTLAYDRYKAAPSAKTYLSVFLCMVLALLSKPMAVTFPFVLIILDLGVYRYRASLNSGMAWISKETILEDLRSKVPLIALSLGMAIITLIAQHSGDSVLSIDSVSLETRLQNAVYGYLIYLKQFILPVDLAAFYPHRNYISLFESMGCLLLLVLVSIYSSIQAKQQPLLAVGWFWYLLVLVPVIGIVQVGGQSHADRYMYLPMFGVLVFCSPLLPDSLEKFNGLKNLVIAGLVVYFSAISFWQIGYWENRHMLFSRVLTVVGPDFRSHSMLAEDYISRGMLENAKYHALEARKIHPSSPYAFRTIGNIALNEKNYSEAEKLYKHAILLGDNTAVVFNNIGIAMAEQGKVESALEYFRLAITVQPNAISPVKNLARYSANN